MKLITRFKNMDVNSKIVFRNTVASFLIKGGSLCLSLFTTPALIRYFNNNTILGVWYTLLSVLAWFLNFDLGIGNGIRNNLVKDFSNNDYASARKTISSGLASNGLVTAVLAFAGIVLIKLVDLNWLFNVGEDIISYEILTKSAVIVFLGIMLRFFLSCISSVFYALQMSAVNNFLALCVSGLQLVFVTLIQPHNSEQGLLILSMGYAIISNAPVCIAGIIVFSTRLKECRPAIRFIDKLNVKKVMGVGTAFFICQIAYMLLMNTNEFLISNLWGPQYTTEYTLYYKLTSLISMVTSLAMTPIWSVVTKAMAEQNYDWVTKLYKKLQIVAVIAMVVQFGFIFVQQFVMDIWLGQESIRVKYSTAVAFACFGSVFIYSSILSTVVCGMARMRLQMACYSIAVLVKFLVVYTMAPVINDWTIVVWSNVLVLLPYCVLQKIDLERYLRRLGDRSIVQ